MADGLRIEIERVLAKVPIDFGGGCSVSKAYVMAWLIRRFRLAPTLDIGVYRGRSLYPQAIAHNKSTGGLVYGVDPWSATEADENDHPQLRQQIKEFVAATDYDALYQQVMRNTEEFGLSSNVRIVRATSADAAKRFAADGTSFGLIHIDGNHDTAIVMRDVDLYLPLLKLGGILVMDDVSWDSVQPAERVVAARTRLLVRHISKNKTNDYAVYRNGGDWPTDIFLRLSLRQLSRSR